VLKGRDGPETKHGEAEHRIGRQREKKTDGGKTNYGTPRKKGETV